MIVTCWKPAGFTLLGGDCDDEDPLVNPRAREWCDGVDDNCTGDESDAEDAEAGYSDADGDGYGFRPIRSCDPGPEFVVIDGDCDEGSADVHPGADEWCNGLDDDCDDEFDEDAVDALPFYADADGDSLGDAASPTSSCAAPPGYVADASDCDDTNAGIGGPILWFTDTDGDAFGATGRRGCTAGSGETEQGGDCDDTDSAVNPGAAEACDSSRDLNCDGLFGTADADLDGLLACEDCDDADPLSGSPSTWYADRDGDTFGDAAHSLQACSAPATFVADSTDCNDVNSVAHPGAPEVWYDDADEDCAGGDDWDADLDGYDAPSADCDDTRAAVNPAMVETCANHLDDDCDGTANGCADSGAYSLEDSPIYLDGAADGDYMGLTFAVAEDYFAVGDAAVIVSASCTDSGAGSVYVARFSDLQAGVTTGTWTSTWTGEASGDQAGTTLSSPGDFDGDGDLDLAVGSFYHADGAVYLIPLATSGTASLSTATARLDAPTDAEWFGWPPLRVPDLDGDSMDELVVAAPRSASSATGIHDGCAFYYASPVVTGASWTGRICGDTDETFWGIDAQLGDVTGDGVPEVLLSSYSGYSAWVSLPFTGNLAITDADGLLEDPRHVTPTVRAGGLGDTNGDGYEDMYTGHTGDATYADYAGAVHVHLGPLGTREEDDDFDWALYGTRENGMLATASTAGDTDGDGATDLLFSETEPLGGGPGRVGLFYGPFGGSVALTDADLLLDGPQDSDAAGVGLLGGVDLNGDAFDDVLVGAPYAGVALSGRAYLWLGTGG